MFNFRPPNPWPWLNVRPPDDSPGFHFTPDSAMQNGAAFGGPTSAVTSIPPGIGLDVENRLPSGNPFDFLEQSPAIDVALDLPHGVQQQARLIGDISEGTNAEPTDSSPGLPIDPPLHDPRVATDGFIRRESYLNDTGDLAVAIRPPADDAIYSGTHPDLEPPSALTRIDRGVGSNSPNQAPATMADRLYEQSRPLRFGLNRHEARPFQAFRLRRRHGITLLRSQVLRLQQMPQRLKKETSLRQPTRKPTKSSKLGRK